MAGSSYASPHRAVFHHPRLTFFPDPRVAELTAILEDRLLAAARQVTAERFASMLDPLFERMIVDAFGDTEAHEGIIMLLEKDETELAVAYQVGPASGPWLGARVPAGAGLRGMVLASQQPFCGNDLYNNPQHDRTLDERIGLVLCATVIVPFYFGRQLRGLIAAMQYKPADSAPDPKGFSPESLEKIELLSTGLGRLLDYRLFCAALGMEE
jgi:GAF domain